MRQEILPLHAFTFASHAADSAPEAPEINALESFVNAQGLAFARAGDGRGHLGQNHRPTHNMQ